MFINTIHWFHTRDILYSTKLRYGTIWNRAFDKLNETLWSPYKKFLKTPLRGVFYGRMVSYVQALPLIFYKHGAYSGDMGGVWETVCLWYRCEFLLELTDGLVAFDRLFVIGRWVVRYVHGFDLGNKDRLGSYGIKGFNGRLQYSIHVLICLHEIGIWHYCTG